MWRTRADSSIAAACRIADCHEVQGDAEAGLAMLDRAIVVHPNSSVLWRARLLIQTKERGDPPGYLRDMAAHALRKVAGQPFRGAPAARVVEG